MAWFYGHLPAVAEMKGALLMERTQADPARAMSEGKTLGRPSKTMAELRADIIAKYAAGESVIALARLQRLASEYPRRCEAITC